MLNTFEPTQPVCIQDSKETEQEQQIAELTVDVTEYLPEPAPTGLPQGNTLTFCLLQLHRATVVWADLDLWKLPGHMLPLASIEELTSVEVRMPDLGLAALDISPKYYAKTP